MKTYKNISNVEQLGLAPNEEGERQLNHDEELRMIDRRAIEVTKDPEADARAAAEAETKAEAEAETETPPEAKVPEGQQQSQKGDRGRGKS